MLLADSPVFKNFQGFLWYPEVERESPDTPETSTGVLASHCPAFSWSLLNAQSDHPRPSLYKEDSMEFGRSVPVRGVSSQF